MDKTGDRALLSPSGLLATQIRSQRVEANASRDLPVFYRNIEEALDVRRATQSFHAISPSNWQTGKAVDFCSSDYLSWNTTGAIRRSFLEELSRHPEFIVAAGGPRILEGNYPYIEETEQEIASFHGAETAMIVTSAFEANVMIWSALPRPGDVILYDSMVHASTHEGMERSLAIQKVEFPHNDVAGFRKALTSIMESQPLINQGKRSVLVAVESVYSMEGDVSPLLELVDIATEFSQGQGNIQFVIDETHGAGLIGPNGTGLVCELGLEGEIAVRVHAYSKAMGASGGIIFGNNTIKSALINFSRNVVFSTAPPFHFVAAIRAGHRLLGTPEFLTASDLLSMSADLKLISIQSQEKVQSLSRTFFATLTSHPLWAKAQSSGLLSVPLANDWEARPFLTHIVTVSTREKYTGWLHTHLLYASFYTSPVKYPVVPLGESRLRVAFHADNTTEQVVTFVSSTFQWVEEIMAIEEGRSDAKVTRAASEVYSWMKQEGLKGYGLE